MHRSVLPSLRCRVITAVIVLGAATAGCLSSSPTEVTFPSGFTRVLFIGNSHTYSHDVPGLAAAIARQNGDDGWRVAQVAFPDMSLEDHWYEGSARRHLENGRWEYVVMQQGPSSQAPHHLAQWAGAFDELARAAGATSVLFQVWPHSTRPFDFPGVLTSYMGAALAVNGLLAPAGEAWVHSMTSHPSLTLYDTDGLHANRYGAYLAALVIYARISGTDPESLPATIPGTPSVDAATVRALQRAARGALEGPQPAPARRF